MSTWEVSFRVKHDYPFIRMSEKHPGTKISMWCVWNREMIHVPVNHEDAISEIDGYVRQIGRAIENYKPTKDGFVVTLTCSCDLNPNTWDFTEKNNCVDVFPSVFLDGWGYYRVISFNEDDVKNLFKELSSLGQVELVSKRLLGIDALPSTVWADSFFSRMTDRQMESLVRAYDHGYYTSPRGVTTDSIATSIGISRSTYEEHLRKAENRIMESIIPYLKLFRAGAQKRGEIASFRPPVPESSE
ncbi:hypothetical protein IX51_10075 [uncultured archaeon]|nr:hypothetical protein IX51_10075 [uncultured archaeon]